jgi:SAM-dependent methyltransferase
MPDPVEPSSLLRAGRYSRGWAKGFYTQAGIWWGTDPQDAGTHHARVETVARLCGPGARRVLDLGTGSGHTAAALADAGHAVVGVEFSPTAIGYAQELLALPRKGALAILEGDYYTIELEGRFDVLCWWQGFGLGSDADQRRVLGRIAHEWLAPGGSALIEVYNPIWAARHAGREVRLAALEGVPGSVAMTERWHFDPIYSRWIDEWEPVADPEEALAQTVRCYTPADLLLLLEGTGLTLRRVEVNGCEVDFSSHQIGLGGPLMEEWSYLAQLVRAEGVG